MTICRRPVGASRLLIIVTTGPLVQHQPGSRDNITKKEVAHGTKHSPIRLHCWLVYIPLPYDPRLVVVVLLLLLSIPFFGQPTISIRHLDLTDADHDGDRSRR